MEKGEPMNEIQALSKIIDELEHRIAYLEANQLNKVKLKAYIDGKMGVSKRTGLAFVPPVEEDVQDLMKSKGLQWKSDSKINSARLFIMKYQQAGWKLGNGNPMKDWSSALQMHYTEPFVASTKVNKVVYCPRCAHPKSQCKC